MFGDLDYSGLGAPGLDSLAQFSTPSYIEAPPHRIDLQYAAPGVYDAGIARSKFHYGPTHRIAMCYGDAASWRPEVNKSYNVNGVLYSLNADASLDVIPLEGSGFTLQPNDPRYAAAFAEIKAMYGASGEKKSGGFWASIKNWFSSGNAAKDIQSAVGSARGGNGTAAGNTIPQESFWDKYGTAIMIGGGLVATAGIVWAVSRADEGASEQIDRLMATRANKGKGRGKKAKKSAKRKSSRKAGRR